MNKELVDSLAKKATTEILGVPCLNETKFARLIIEQCCEVIENNTVTNGAGGFLKVGTAEQIKQHFGVE